MGRPWWYDSYWEKKEKKRRRLRMPNRKIWVWFALIAFSLLLSAVGLDFQLTWSAFIIGIVYYFCRILALSIFIRVLLSWFGVRPYSWPVIILYDLTSPVLDPLKRIVPKFGGLDLSPMLAMLILFFIPTIIDRLVYLIT